VRRSGASSAFVWSQLPHPRAAVALRLPPSRPPVRVVVGGPGWAAHDLPPGCVVVADLVAAVRALAGPYPAG
jgi:hypothetical protein